MTGRDVEKGLFGLAAGVVRLGSEIFRDIAHPDDESVAEGGIAEPKTFSVPFEEGGKSRFLPALSIAVAAVHPDENLEPRDVFDECKAVLDQRGRPIKRSDDPRSTRNTLAALFEDRDKMPQFLKEVEIEPRSREDAGFANGERELSVPTTPDRSVLLLPFNRKMFNTTVELPDEVKPIPLWGVAFGVFKPTDQKRHQVRGADLSPVSILYKVAFPVPPGMVGHEDEGKVESVPALLMMNMLSREEIAPGYSNQTYIVSQEQA